MQNQIFTFAVLSRFNLVAYAQKVFVSSLFSKLKVVKTVDIYGKKISLSNTHRLQIVFNIRKRVFSRNMLSFYVTKKIGSSKLFDIPDVYFLLRSNLLDLSFQPYYEVFLNRFSFAYRPFRFIHDVFKFLRVKFNSNEGKKRLFLSRFFEILRPYSRLEGLRLRSDLSIYLYNQANDYINNSNFIITSFLNFSIIGLVPYKINYN